MRPAKYLDDAVARIGTSYVLGVTADEIPEFMVIFVAHTANRWIEKLANIALVKPGLADEMVLINHRRRQFAEIDMHTQPVQKNLSCFNQPGM